MGSINIIQPLATALSNAINNSQQHLVRKILGNAENHTQGRWVRSKYASMLKRPADCTIETLTILLNGKEDK